MITFVSSWVAGLVRISWINVIASANMAMIYQRTAWPLRKGFGKATLPTVGSTYCMLTGEPQDDTHRTGRCSYLFALGLVVVEEAVLVA